MGKILILYGIVLIIAGIAIILWGRIPWVGRLPGDICIRKKDFMFYFPITTGILMSLLLTIIFSLFRKR